MFHRLGQGECPQEVAEIVGQCMKLKPDGIVAEPSAREARPLDGVLEVSELRRAWRQTSAAPVVWLAKTRPILWRQLISHFGTWGVPGTIWRRVRDEKFRAQMRRFAEECLEIVAREKPLASG